MKYTIPVIIKTGNASPINANIISIYEEHPSRCYHPTNSMNRTWYIFGLAKNTGSRNQYGAWLREVFAF